MGRILETENIDVNTKSILLTVVATISSLISLFILLYSWAGVVVTKITSLLGVEKVDKYVIFDAIISFLILYIFFTFLKFIQKIHSDFVILFCAVFLFLYWGFESEAFWNGLNPTYPAWYEINMATNKFVAGILAMFSHQRLTRRIQAAQVSNYNH